MGTDGDFLRAHIAVEVRERLEDINRPFPSRLDLGGNMVPFIPSQPKAVTVLPLADVTEEALDIQPASFDLILSNLDLHSFNDIPGILVQCRQALRPDGLMLATLFGGETLYELRESLLAAEAEIKGGAAQRIAPFADVRDMGGLLQRAGFALPVADSERVTIRYEHPMKLMMDLRAMGETNALSGRSRKFLRRDVLARCCEIYLERFGGSGGRIQATFDVIYLGRLAPT